MSSLSRNSATIHEYNFTFDRIKEFHSEKQQQQNLTNNNKNNNHIFHFQRPTTSSIASCSSAKRPQSKGSRLHQILLTNQHSLNNIVFDVLSCDSNSSMSSSRTPRINYSNEASLSVLVKKPFKHFVNTKSVSVASSSATSKRQTINSDDVLNSSSNMSDTALNTKLNAGQNEVGFLSLQKYCLASVRGLRVELSYLNETLTFFFEK